MRTIIAIREMTQQIPKCVDFTIDVSATDTAGNRSDWLATCKASGTGKVKTLDLARLDAKGEIAVAQSN